MKHRNSTRGSYVFFGGAISVEIMSVTEIAKGGFIENMLRGATLRAA